MSLHRAGAGVPQPGHPSKSHNLVQVWGVAPTCSPLPLGHTPPNAEKQPCWVQVRGRLMKLILSPSSHLQARGSALDPALSQSPDGTPPFQ